MLVFERPENATPIELVSASDIDDWRGQQSELVLAWANRSKFKGSANQFFSVPDETGFPQRVVAGTGKTVSVESIGSLSQRLPAGNYYLADPDPDSVYALSLGWGMGAYEFTQYKTEKKKSDTNVCLYIDPKYQSVCEELDSMNLARDLINTSAGDLLPDQLEIAVQNVCDQFDTSLNVVRGDDLLERGFRTIHSVGRASYSQPRLLHFNWGPEDAPKVAILGKGVCFDSGGLDLKSAAGMREMKKDMAGAAITLGLAQLIMYRNLNVRLHALIPAVENAVSSNAYHPGDVITTYKGTTVEVGNTDAEGRLILCDALALAAEDKPELMVDFSTLTGAARTAVGSEISAMFSNNDKVANALLEAGDQTRDPIWRLPLYSGYRGFLKKSLADLSNIGSESMGGAITAALFLEHFVDEIPWVHFDLMGSNTRTRPAHPFGGEAMALRAVFHYLNERYGTIG
ncbi:MAG: leucyl aminopeptidase family protein [Gammaproteobacteria bacterium]|nr:leucyl aminopeptidase family protein [Gammaproteobacteria bacterium]